MPLHTHVGRESPEFITCVPDDPEGFADELTFKRYDVRKVRDSPVGVPRYRMRSGNYRIVSFLRQHRLINE